jgi:hypothetical protein
VAEVAESVGGFELLIDGPWGLAIPQTIEPDYLLDGAGCSWHQVRR